MAELPEQKNVLLDVNNEKIQKNSLAQDSTSNEISLNSSSEINDKNINQLLEEPVTSESETAQNNDYIPEPNCLALTVRKDYNLTILKNIFTKTGRMSLKVALSTLVLNFLRMFF